MLWVLELCSLWQNARVLIRPGRLNWGIFWRWQELFMAQYSCYVYMGVRPYHFLSYLQNWCPEGFKYFFTMLCSAVSGLCRYLGTVWILERILRSLLVLEVYCRSPLHSTRIRDMLSILRRYVLHLAWKPPVFDNGIGPPWSLIIASPFGCWVCTRLCHCKRLTKLRGEGEVSWCLSVFD